MKVQAHNNKLETNVESESKEFGIGDASVVIEILRNRLYENKIQTLVQEYICNARDAHREVGKDASTIQVTMPTRLSPTFKVKDFGPGISPDRMDRVFRLYGASTKRGSNNQTGGFGIGAKSAWSYTDSFTVVTVVDCVRRTYVCHTGNNNQGSLDLVSTNHTDESNGTEIQIAVKSIDLDQFMEAILRAIYFWTDRPQVKGWDGELPTLTPGYKLSDNIETIDKSMIPGFIGLNYYSDSLAVIDGVPYIISEKLLSKTTKLKGLKDSIKKSIILHFSNGIVEVSASRESIADSQFSIDALNKMGAKGGELVKKHVTERFAKAKTTSEWLNTYKELNTYFEVDKYSGFGDYKIEDGRIVSGKLNHISMTLVHCLDKRKRYVVDRISKEELSRVHERTIPINMLDRVFLVTKSETKIVENKRLRAYFDGKPAELSKVILLNYSGDPVDVDQVVADLGVKTFESLQYVDKPKEPKVKVQREHSEICMHSFYGSRHTYTTLAKNQKRYLYVAVSDGNWEGFDQRKLRDLAYHLRSELDLEVVGLADKSIKMVQGDANFSPLKDWLAEFKPTKAQINYAIATNAKNGRDIKVLFDLEVKDEFLTEMAKEYKSILEGMRKISEIPDLLVAKVKEAVDAADFFEKDAKLEKLLNEKYPLVKEIGGYTEHRKELAFYINAKYTN